MCRGEALGKSRKPDLRSKAGGHRLVNRLALMRALAWTTRVSKQSTAASLLAVTRKKLQMAKKRKSTETPAAPSSARINVSRRLRARKFASTSTPSTRCRLGGLAVLVFTARRST